MTSTLLTRHDLSWVEAFPELDDKQLGAIRRIANLAGQLKGDWSGMHMREMVLSEDFSSLRYQLAYMAYALGLGHVHRLPAAPVVFKKTMDDIIQKLLHPDVWFYWSNVSTGMGPLNKDLGPLDREWDPVINDNIMYSAYLMSVVLMYHYLFRDDKYTREGSLRLRVNTFFWHEGGFLFEYDEKKLTSHIYWQMAEQGFMGVSCEPGLIFQICNQPTILGLRFHDLVYGGSLAEDAEKGYVQCWNEFGIVDEETGLFRAIFTKKSRTVVTLENPQMSFWPMAMMHSWYPEFVEEQYPRILKHFLLDGPDGTKWVKPVQHLPDEEGEEFLLPPIDVAWTACAASEMGDTETLDGILAYADRFMNPAWQDGGFYYKRRDANFDDDGYFIGMDAGAGNAFFHYARLNVKDGLRKLYSEPLPEAHFAQPALIDLTDGIEVRRAIYVPERKALVLTFDTIPSERTIKLGIRADRSLGIPVVFQDGEEIVTDISRREDGLELKIAHSAKSTLVFQW